MVCPHCRNTNPEGSTVCKTCSTPFEIDDATILAEPREPGATIGMESHGTWAQPAVLEGSITGTPLQPGTVLAGRYEILKLLGEGGMGFVYRARDRELEREVAVKVIRPELARNAQVLQRFKQELILARQVTHRNIIRIFDLGSSEGMRFITMQYIEGEDIAQVLSRRKKLPAEEAARIIAQVARGLDAAHAEGVIHRDLKPQNIMIDAAGKASVMDFGIARSVDASSMTRTGAILGTPAYMSPEQAQGLRVDARSDLYMLGVIFYELLTGKLPFETEHPMAALVRRIHEAPAATIEIDPTVPKPVNAIVMKMLATKPEARYQSASELLADLDAWEAVRTGRTIQVAAVRTGIPISYVAAAMLFVVALGVWLYSRKGSAPAAPPPRKIVRVLVSDFQNATGDSVFDGTLEPTFALAMEGASFINSYSRGDARKQANLLRPGFRQLDEKLAQLVAKSEGIDVVVAGSIASAGSAYQIHAKAIDGFTGKTLVEKTASARNKQDVLTTAGKLAVPLRKALGDTTPEAAQLRAAETYSSSSIEASQAYAQGQELQWDLKYLEAIPFYQKAIAADPGMGRAYAGLAVAYHNIDRNSEAEKYFQLAMSKTARMTEREQYRTRGAYYLFTRNDQKAVEEFTALTRQFPADDAGRINLTFADFYTREFMRALEEGQRLIQQNPKNAFYRSNTALYAMYAGQFDDAIHGAAEAMKLSPRPKPYVATALSLFAQGKIPEAADTYHKLESLGAQGASLASIGLADIALYEGRNHDAVAILRKGIASDLEAEQTTGASIKMAALASALRKGHEAVAEANRSLKTDADGADFAAARVLLENGQEAKALAIARQMGASLAADRRAYGKLLEGEAQLAKGRAQAAIDLFQESKKLANTWLGHFDLGRAYLEAGAFPEASSEFDACEKRKGEATAVFLDDVPSFRYFPPLYYYQGRVREGMKRVDAAEAYKTFVAIKSKADPGDPLVADAVRRIGQ
jgi:tetratricopeptide (TPR) repeat protein